MAVYDETSTTAAIQDVADQIQELLLKRVAVRVESPDADIVGTGILDSLALVRLMSALEERFGIDSGTILLDIDSYRSINAIAAAIVERRPGARGPEAREPRNYAGEIQALLLDRLSIRVDSTTADLFRTGALDSMSLVRFIMVLEDYYGIQLPIDELDVESFRNLENVSELVVRYTAGRDGLAFGRAE